MTKPKRPTEIWTRYDDGSMDFVKVSGPSVCKICRAVKTLISPFTVKNPQIFEEEPLRFSERFYAGKPGVKTMSESVSKPRDFELVQVHEVDGRQGKYAEVSIRDKSGSLVYVGNLPMAKDPENYYATSVSGATEECAWKDDGRDGYGRSWHCDACGKCVFYEEFKPETCVKDDPAHVISPGWKPGKKPSNRDFPHPDEVASGSMRTRCPVCDKGGGHTYPGNCEGPGTVRFGQG